MTTNVKYINELQADGTSKLVGPTREMWRNCPKLSEMIDDPEVGYFWYDNFTNAPTLATAGTGLGAYNGHYVVGTYGTVTGVAAKGGGAIFYTTTDAEEVGLAPGGTGGGPFVIPATSTSEAELWFECRVKKTLVTADKLGFFVGMAGAGACADGFLAETDLGDFDVLGFWNLEAGAVIDIVCQKTGAAFDVIMDDVYTLLADTWVKLGFHYDPHAVDTEKISFWIDGVEQTTYVGENSGDATVYLGDTTNFPGGESMTPIIWLEAAHADNASVTMDWWRCVQRGENN